MAEISPHRPDMRCICILHTALHMDLSIDTGSRSSYLMSASKIREGLGATERRITVFTAVRGPVGGLPRARDKMGEQNVVRPRLEFRLVGKL